jgi:hypothetical protein
MIKTRSAVYNKSDNKIRMNMMSLASTDKSDNSTRKLDNRDAQPTPANINFDLNNDADLITWARTQIENPDYRWRNVKITKIDTEKNEVTYYTKDGIMKRFPLKTYLDDLRQELKFDKNEVKVDGQVSTRQDIINLIKQDIQNQRPYKGKNILSIDESKGTVTLEGDSVLGFKNIVKLDAFISDYTEYRKFGYKDSDTIVQDLTEQTRKQNIEDMATAFKQALGIKAPKIETYKPTRETRSIGQFSSIMTTRDKPYIWTVDELSSVYKTGSIYNATTQVTGELNNTFNPVAPEQKISREGDSLSQIPFYNQI